MEEKLTNQIYVNAKNDLDLIINALIEKNYENVQHLSKKNPTKLPHIICVDLVRKIFHATNVTCLACLCSCNKRPIIYNYPNFIRLL